MKINFTEKHMQALEELAVEALFKNVIFTTKLGQPLNIYELLHTTSINQLTEMKNSLAKAIQKKEEGDEWVEVDSEKLGNLKFMKELVNLVIGYKRYKLEEQAIMAKKAELSAKLTELKESQKTPEDRIKEIEQQLKELDEF